MPKFNWRRLHRKDYDMKTVNGVYTSAKIFTTTNEINAIDDYAVHQIKMLCDNEISKGCQIRIMPDVHPGKVGVIGLTMTIGSKVMPNLVGADIGCGMTLAAVKCKKIEFQKLDTVIRETIPSGFAVRSKPHHLSEEADLSQLYCSHHIRKEKALLSLGSLGGGNHFIELDRDSEGQVYIVVHSGSRHLGKEVTDYYISEGQKVLKEKGLEIPYELTYLEGDLLGHYLHDLAVVQDFAALNREIILTELAKGMKWKILETYSCIHNYVDMTKETIDAFHSPILRKGAVSARREEPVIIPINMRDGIILGTGLGNRDWNHSAPHGSGRIMKREDIKSHYTVSEFKAAMKGIYSSSIGKETLDEAPFAYRALDDIKAAISDTVKIEKIIKPVFSYKAGKGENHE